MRSPEEQVQVGCIMAALDLLLRHSQRPQLVTTATKRQRARCDSFVGIITMCVRACVSMPYLQLTAVSVCRVLQLLCVHAPWWPSQDKHQLLSTVRQ